MAILEVEDSQTGKRVKFDWQEDREPTQSDLLAVFAENNRTTPTQPEMPWYQNAAIGVGKGLTDFGTGALQRVLEGGEAIRSGLGMESNQANIDRLKAITAENRQAFAPLAEQSTAANIGEFVGQAAPTVAMPGGVAGGFMKRAGTSALAGGAVGALQPTIGNESVMTNATTGAAAGAGGSAVMSGAGKVGNALMDRLPPNMIEALSRKYGIRTTLGEVTENPLIKKAETWLENVPLIGLGSFRKKQLGEAENAAKGFFAKYVVDPSLDRTSSMKESNDVFIDKLYENFKKVIKDVPTGEVPTTKQTTTQLLETYPDVFNSIQNRNVKNILKDIMGDVRDKSVDTGLVNQSGAPIIRQYTPTFSADDIWMLRKGLGKEIGVAKDDIARGQLKSLYASVSNDFDALLDKSQSPAVGIFREANDKFKQYSVKFDALREAFDAAEGTTKAGEMFSPKKFSTSLKNLANDPNYKKNVQWSPQEIDEMTGLANILQVVKRSAQYVENPPTGNRWGSLLAGGGLAGISFANPATGAKTIGAIGATRFLTSTEAGKRIARAASMIEPDNPNMKVLIKMVYNQLPKYMANEATDK